VKVSIVFRLGATVLLAGALLGPPLAARTKKGDRFLKEGEKAELKKDYDTALTYYDQALEEDSRDPAYMLADQRARGRAAEQHVSQGKKLLEQQKLNEALVQFQKALLTDPSSQIALQGIGDTNQMLKEKARVPEGTPVFTPAEKARQAIEKRINSLEGPPALRPISNQIDSLKLNNQTSRVLYESVGKLAGINVLLDPAGIDSVGAGSRNFNLDLNHVLLDEALDYVALVTHTFWKPISRNAIFVTQESEQKRQEYQDEVVRVFYVQNASSPNEFNEIFNGLRAGAKLTTGIFQVASQNAIVVRGSPDTLAICEKLIHDLDRAKPEVVVDIIVLEVSKSKISNLGAALANQAGTAGLSLPVTFSPGQGPTGASTTTPSSTSTSTSSTSTSTTTAGTIPLSRLNRVSTNDFQISLPGALAEALLTDSSSRILQRPQVRVTDNGKASLKIGSRIPYVSGSLNSAVATPGSIPYATTQFQQVDVGVNVDLQPHVNGADEISMHIKVEISNVVRTESIAGVDQPVIGQKVNEAEIRMRDGEVSLLGGLSSDSDSTSVAGIPGIANMPVLGYLFGTRSKDREKDDIIVALIPRIIRAPVPIDASSEGVLAGTERVVRVERRQENPVAVAQPAPSVQQQPQSVPPARSPIGDAQQTLPPTQNPRLPVVIPAPAPNTTTPGVSPPATPPNGAAPLLTGPRPPKPNQPNQQQQQ
jgi:general secretion pathway protein D